MATAELASDLSSGSKKPEPDNSVPTSEIYSWASQLASESRKLDWVFYWYVWPDAVREIIPSSKRCDGIIGLVSSQGAGQSRALQGGGRGAKKSFGGRMGDLDLCGELGLSMQAVSLVYDRHGATSPRDESSKRG